jgi:putative FmdB family regulatory protein
MPTYDYRCAKCGEDLEVYQSFSEAPLKKHASCGGKLTKVFPSVGIVLKGSGFYKTDSRESSKARSKAREESSANGDSKSSDTKTADTKTAETKGSETKSASSNGSSKSPGEKANGERKSEKSPVKST